MDTEVSVQEANIKNYQQSRALTSTTFVIILIAIFYLISGLFLTKYPTAYMDEAWNDSVFISLLKNREFKFSVFRESPGYYPMGLFYLLTHYISFKFFGYTLFAARLPSLLCIGGSTLFIYLIIQRLTSDNRLGFFAALLFSVTETAVYASHLARQEALFLLWSLLCVYLFLKMVKSDLLYKHFLFGLLCGVAFEIHLNAFVLCLCFTLLYCFYENRNWSEKIKRVIAWGIGSASMLLLWFLVRYLMDPLIFKNVFSLGASHGLFSDLTARMEKNIIFFANNFWEPRYHRKMLEFTILCISVIGSCYLLKSKTYDIRYKSALKLFLICLFSYNIGFLIMNIFDTNFIILVYPFFMVLFCMVLFGLQDLFKKVKVSAQKIIVILILIFAGQNMYAFYKFSPSDYEAYLAQVKAFIPPGSIVIGDVRFGYGFFENYDYIALRDLSYAINVKNMSSEEYFKKFQIQYVLYTEYWDYMINHDTDYGKIDREIDKIKFKQFIDNDTELTGVVHDYVYGMANQKFGNCWTKIYRIK